MRIAQQIAHAFCVDIDKDVVRRVLAKHYREDDSGSSGPSWLILIAKARTLSGAWTLFRRESIVLRSHWVLLAMYVFTCRIIGFGVEREYIDGVSVCRMFNQAVAGQHRASTSAPITTRYFASTVGSPIYRYSKSMRSSQFQTFQFHIRSSNDGSAPFAANISIVCSSGTPST